MFTAEILNPIESCERQMIAAMHVVTEGVLERFPRLRLGILESGAGWIGSLLDRMDALFEHPFFRSHGMRTKPSDLFRRQCFISGDPDEPSAVYAMKYLGPEYFMWATDFPHPDHTGSWVPELGEFVERVDERTRDLVLGDDDRASRGVPIYVENEERLITVGGVGDLDRADRADVSRLRQRADAVPFEIRDQSDSVADLVGRRERRGHPASGRYDRCSSHGLVPP